MVSQNKVDDWIGNENGYRILVVIGHRDQEAHMARSETRPVVKLRSTAGTGHTYVTRKSRRNTPDRLRLKKYDPVVRRHVEFREER